MTNRIRIVTAVPRDIRRDIVLHDQNLVLDRGAESLEGGQVESRLDDENMRRIVVTCLIPNSKSRESEREIYKFRDSRLDLYSVTDFVSINVLICIYQGI